MEYGLMSDLEIFKSPVVIIFEGIEKKYKDGITAKSDAKFSKPVIVSKIQARNNEILVYVEENPHYNDASWTNDKEVSFF